MHDLLLEQFLRKADDNYCNDRKSHLHNRYNREDDLLKIVQVFKMFHINILKIAGLSFSRFFQQFIANFYYSIFFLSSYLLNVLYLNLKLRFSFQGEAQISIPWKKFWLRTEKLTQKK